MYESLRGKKLLVIGSAEIDTNIVKAAHELGVYVIVADGVRQSAATFAKNIADEAWDIDYSKTQQLGEKCKAAKVDGVLAGYSEMRVSTACRVANYLGLPFYATPEQIELTRNKCSFKEACRKYGIKVPADYRIDNAGKVKDFSDIPFPVIVKPADAAGRKGISLCSSKAELDSAVELALQYSISKTAIVEEYLTGVEYCAIYTLQDGKYSLSCFNEKYLCHAAKARGLCDLALTPSSHLAMFQKNTDSRIREFLAGIGAKDGVAFFQGVITEQDCYVFEMGYRLNGGNDYFIVERENHISYMKMLIAHSLTGAMEGELHRDNPDFRKLYANFLLYARAGTVGKICFDGDIQKPGLEDIHIKKVPGMVVKDDGTTLQCAFTFKLSAHTRDELAELVAYCQEHAVIRDTEDNDMTLCKFDTSRLFDHS